MNEIVFVPIPPLPPKISPSEISTFAKSKNESFTFKEVQSSQEDVRLSLQNAEGIFIRKCSTIQDSLQMLSMPWFIEKFNESTVTFMIKIEIGSSVDSLEAVAVLNLMKEFSKQFSIILFQTFSGKCQIFWKFYNEKSFYLKMDSEASNFVLNFLASSLKNDHSGVSRDILAFNTVNEQICELDLLSLIDSRNFNLLMLAAEDGDAVVVDSLLQHGFDVNVLINDDTAIDLAYDNQHFQIVLVLLHANSLYPKNFSNSQLNDELKKFIGISRGLHNSIRQGKSEEVEAIIDENPNLRHFYTTKNLSAAAQAVLCREFEIYEILISRNVYIGPKEDFNAILRKVSKKSCENMRGIHLDYIQSSSAKHLMILTVNSFVGHDIPDVDEKLKHITKAFNYLDKVDPLISLILKVVAASRDFKIIFDFHRQSIQHLDPTSSQFTRGVYHTSRHIYIAAQQMLDSNTIHETYGTMAHELCHYAMHLVYHNDCRPYYNDEYKIIQRFTAIAFLCKNRQEKENLIGCVFRLYEKELQHAELIVRVPHMIAEYSNNHSRLEECRQNFPELFQFAENVTAVDMENSLSDIEIQAEDEIRKFAHRVKKQERENFYLWVFSISCILILPFMVWVTLLLSDSSKPIYSCTNLTDQRWKILKSTVNFQGVPVIFEDLFGNETNSCADLTTDEIGKMLDIYDLNQFMSSSMNVYQEVNDKKIIENEADETNSEDIFNKYKDYNFRVPSINVSSKIDLKTPFYIGRRVHQKLSGGGTRNVLSFSELTSKKIVFFSDSAGNGKSTTFRRAAWKLKRSLPLHWVSYVDLKEHIEELKKISINELNTTSIVEFISDKILKLTSKVDQNIFHQKFSTNSVVVLWDGVDEVSPICTENILGLIEKITNLTENMQWISTRVHLEDRLAKKFNVKIYALDPYNESDRMNFIQSFLESQNVTNEAASMMKAEINSTISRLESSNKDRPNAFINTPLMTEMFCKAHYNMFVADGGKIMASNSSEPANIYAFYEDFFERLLLIAINEKGKIVQGDVAFRVNRRNDYKKIHQYYGLNLIFSSSQLKDIFTRSEIEYKNLSIIMELKLTPLPNEEITRLGILFEDYKGALKFEHRTYAEYFVAQFFYEKLWDIISTSVTDSEIKLRLQLLFSIMNDVKKFNVIIDFINGFLDKYESENKHPFLGSIRKMMKEDFRELFHYLGEDSIEVATKFFKKDKKVIDILWKINESATFLHEHFHSYSTLETFNNLKKIIEQNFNEDDQMKILNGKNQRIYILYRIWKGQFNFSSYLSSIETLEAMQEKLSDTLSIVEFLEFIDTLNCSNLEFEEFFRQISSEIIMDKTDISDFTQYWRFMEGKLNENEMKRVLFHKEIRTDQTILFNIRELDLEYVQVLLNVIKTYLTPNEFSELFLQRDRDDNATFLSHKIELNNQLEIFQIIWNFIENNTPMHTQKQMLASFNGTTRTLKAVWDDENTDTFVFYKDIFMKLYSKQELCDMIVELEENQEIFVINDDEDDTDKSELSKERENFLEEIFEGDQKRLEDIYSRIPSSYKR